jgi:hypothetical protein
MPHRPQSSAPVPNRPHATQSAPPSAWDCRHQSASRRIRLLPPLVMAALVMPASSPHRRIRGSPTSLRRISSSLRPRLSSSVCSAPDPSAPPLAMAPAWNSLLPYRTSPSCSLSVSAQARLPHRLCMLQSGRRAQGVCLSWYAPTLQKSIIGAGARPPPGVHPLPSLPPLKSCCPPPAPRSVALPGGSILWFAAPLLNLLLSIARDLPHTAWSRIRCWRPCHYRSCRGCARCWPGTSTDDGFLLAPASMRSPSRDLRWAPWERALAWSSLSCMPHSAYPCSLPM